MSVGATMYAYRNNFGCKTESKRKGRKTKLKLFNLIADGYRTISKYDDDYFISICQWLMKKGYPYTLSVSDKTSGIDSFFMGALFSVCPFRAQSLMINKSGFNVFDWREQFELFNEIEVSGLNFYRNRKSMPLEDFTSLSDIYKIVFTNYDKYNGPNQTLKFSFNSSCKNAIWILSKYCIVEQDTLYYTIDYGCKDDFENNKKGKACSSWSLTIKSEKGENYVDFIIKIYENYEQIISGDKAVLQSISYDNSDKFYLGGNFKFRIA